MNPITAAEWLQHIKRDRIIAVIRTGSQETSFRLVEAAIAAGLRQIEITSTSAGFTRTIAQLRARYPTCTIGTGTVLNAKVGREAIAAGAQFIFSPYLTVDVIELALQHDIAVVPGALTPTEIGTAWSAGATAVKVFPIQAVGGAQYLQALQGPMGHIPLIPTGGVCCGDAHKFFDAGAIAVGLGGSLFPKQLVGAQDWQGLEFHIRTFLATQLDRRPPGTLPMGKLQSDRQTIPCHPCDGHPQSLPH
ncbi:MAG: bifunctional 4-hydroxy-2-oxoglutarate aldolase/2-dehydro-3-deoxy-phosphogluconate aldolase [Synechococcus sp.]